MLSWQAAFQVCARSPGLLGISALILSLQRQSLLQVRGYIPLDYRALGLPEALLLVPPSCVWHIPCKLGLHCDVIFQCHVADLQVNDRKSNDALKVQSELPAPFSIPLAVALL